MSGDYLQGLHHRLQDAAVTIHDLSDPAPHLDGPHPHADLLKAFAGALNQVAELVRAVDLDLSQDESLCARDLESMATLTRAFQPSRETTHCADCWQWHPDCARGRIAQALLWLDRAVDEAEAGGGPTATTLAKHTRRILWGMG